MKRESLSGDCPKVVVIGGGTGLSVLLRGLKKKPLDLTAIVTVADDGGSSGRLRDEMQIPPPGDVRNVLLALADVEPLLNRLLQHRFVNGNGLAGHNLGNLLIAAMTEIAGDFVLAIKELCKVLAVRGTVLPSAHQAVILKAEMEDGEIVEGESKIPLAGKRIKRVFLEPKDVSPLQEALEAIEGADAVIVGPGSLYTSILPNLLVPGIAETIRKSKAAKIYIVNVMTQPGETDRFTASDHVEAIYQHVGPSLFDYVFVNQEDIAEAIRRQYARKGQELVRFDRERLERYGFRVIADDFIQCGTYVRHNADKVSDRIVEVVSAQRLP